MRSVYEAHGVRMRMLDSERFILDSVAAFFLKYDDPAGWPETVLDVGAHVGSLSILAAKKGARVIALEPDSQNYAELCFNVLLNGVSDLVLPVKVAAWKEPAMLKLRSAGQARLNTGQRSLLYRSEFSSVEDVLGLPLGTILKWFGDDSHDPFEIDYVKMDVEGAEHVIVPATPPEVLLRARRWELDLHSLKKQAYFDVPGADDERIIRTFVEAGFTVSGTADHVVCRRKA